MRPAFLLNLALYQLGWFACVGGAAAGRPWWGMGLALGLVALHLLLVSERVTQLKLVLLAGLLGLTLDTLQVNLGVFQFPTGSIAAWLAPPWIVVLWMQFATTLDFSLSWLSGRPLVAAAMGLIGGPAAFFAGEKMGAVVFAPPKLTSYAIVGAVWGLGLPLLFAAAERLRAGHGRRSRYHFPGAELPPLRGGRSQHRGSVSRPGAKA